MTIANGFAQRQNWTDVSTPGMLLHTTSASTSLGICCGRNYGGMEQIMHGFVAMVAALVKLDVNIIMEVFI